MSTTRNEGGPRRALSNSLDLTVLSSYDYMQLQDEPDMIIEIIDLYLDDVPRRMAAMRSAASEEDASSIRRQAHNIRGSSGNVGAMQMAAICDALEHVVPEDKFANISILLDSLEEELAPVRYLLLKEQQRRSQ